MRAWAGPIVLTAILVACSSSDTNDDVAPACNGISSEGLAIEQTQSGQCPTNPMTLTGTAGDGDACSQSTDCAPTKCTCAGSNDCAWVAQCSGGSCLQGSMACCLYSQQCN